MNSMHSVLVAAFVAACLPVAAKSADETLVQRGAYLATAGGCASCHTANEQSPYAGGLDIQTPFGMLRSANVTPDVDTGIGSWTEEDFERALRQGVRKDGAALYPAMPYTHFTKITDEDIHALWAYVRSLTPVTNKVDVNELPFPYNIRTNLIAWKQLFFEPGRFQPDPAMSPEAQRGAYLVESLGHCGSCHTPKNALGGAETDRILAGGQVEEWYAPNISNDSTSVLANFTVDSLAQFLATGGDGHDRTVFGKMSEVVHDSLSRLRPEDVHAIAVYLKNRTPANPTEPPAPAVVDDTRREAGAALYLENCQSCHGENGVGKPGVGGRLADNAALTDGPPLNVIDVMLQGIEARGAWGVMPAFTKLTDEQVADIANYVRTSWGNSAGTLATAQDAANLRQAAGPGPKALCASVPESRMDAGTRAALAALGDPVTPEALAPVVKAYTAAHADLSETDKIVALTGTYCESVEKHTDDSDTVISRQLAFMNTVNALVGSDSR